MEVIKAPTVFATHFHELTALAHNNVDQGTCGKQFAGIANYHVSAHIDPSSRKLTMLYKVHNFALFVVNDMITNRLLFIRLDTQCLRFTLHLDWQGQKKCICSFSS